jgi:hypothetical protein
MGPSAERCFYFSPLGLESNNWEKKTRVVTSWMISHRTAIPSSPRLFAHAERTPLL